MTGQYKVEIANDDSNSRIFTVRLFFTTDGIGLTQTQGGAKVFNTDTDTRPAANYFTVAGNRVVDVSALEYNGEAVTGVRLRWVKGLSNIWQDGCNGWVLVDSEGNKYIDFTEKGSFEADYTCCGGWFASTDFDDDADGDLYFAPYVEPKLGGQDTHNQTIAAILEFQKKTD